MNRDYGAELDALKAQMAELERLVRSMAGAEVKSAEAGTADNRQKELLVQGGGGEAGAMYFSGYYRSGEQTVRCEPQEKASRELLGLNRGKAAKVLAALGHKQRLDLLLELWDEALTGAELVERLNMGTTGQLYHHLKALTGADLLVQEERGGRYTIPSHRRFSILLLLSAMSDLIDTSDYIAMTEARDEAHSYLGASSKEGYDLHQLLWAVVNNSLEEHEAGYCSEVGIYLHDDGSATVADNGRGIPTRLLPQTGQPTVQSILTKMDMFSHSASSFVAPGAEKGIGIAVVNALSHSLSVEIRRDGGIYRQEYRHGIPRSGLMTVGETNDTGTSVTFKPEQELFAGRFDKAKIEARAAELREAYPGLRIRIQ
ncbi:ATP-binding protein [Paenibacillus doosanensis]|uniref:DNA topoisomerase (ATP-hydrolyzing) n=1 Tax=Paenibacillus konkukensis TaxID=2020716 RepID=A0ABY4RM53_9BACL|nr:MULTISPECIES: ATP-binding protein [Paenibacillus]MCS7462390.1 ATP-binding protein [Paenibacillus doosanensis]UQZ83228.1 DNA gyrase subunit B [Paenibacillus konkukensis]